jgi:phospho-N-acetylmuramoyl-pentapeptide-transferase
MANSLAFLLLYLIIGSIATFLIIPYYIRFLYRYKLGKKIREEWLIGKAVEFARLHAAKIGTPTLGGWVILIVILIMVGLSILLQYLAPRFGFEINYSLFNRNETYLALFTLFTVWGIGLVDDLLNIREVWRTKGLSARVKLILLFLFAALWAYWFYFKLGYQDISIPFLGSVDIGIWYIPLFVLIIATMANSVNITDGLDGLAWGLLLFNYAVYALICYSQNLTILSALCLIICGSLIWFLWFNIKPAAFYMGDIGSLSLWATLAIMAMMTDTLIVLLITSGIFWLELFSVIIQITSKKFRNGKKVFRIAPFHHHLEAIGWSEENIVMRFWLIWMILAVLGGVVSQLI